MNECRRVFGADALARCAPSGPEKNLVRTTAHAAVATYCLLPGQEVKAHRHPGGQDTWVILAGEGEYYLGDGAVQPIRAGDIAVAEAGRVHGARNSGSADLVFVSILSPSTAGIEPVE